MVSASSSSSSSRASGGKENMISWLDWSTTIYSSSRPPWVSSDVSIRSQTPTRHHVQVHLRHRHSFDVYLVHHDIIWIKRTIRFRSSMHHHRLILIQFRHLLSKQSNVVVGQCLPFSQARCIDLHLSRRLRHRPSTWHRRLVNGLVVPRCNSHLGFAHDQLTND
jgi:hypothetical protein